MGDRALRLTRWATVAAALLVLWQAASLWLGRSPSPPLGIERAASTVGAAEGDLASTPAAAPLPDRFAAIATSGIFGAVVPTDSAARPSGPAKPALVGIAGGRVLLQMPDGATALLGVGGEWNGVKVIEIATNRVLIESHGKRSELEIYAGMGSASLLPSTPPPPKEQKP